MKTKTQIKKDKKNYLAIALVIVMIVLAVGYASFTQTLTITGTVNGSATWNVHFVDASCGIVNTAGTETVLDASSASLSNANAAGGNTTLTVNLTGDNKLNYPGDAKKVRATIKNDSSVPVKLTGFTVTTTNSSDAAVTLASNSSTASSASNQNMWFDYVTLTTSSATPGAATSGEVLEAGATCTYEFVIGWLPDSTLTTLDATKYSITLNYMQSTDTSDLVSSHGAHVNP